MIDTLYVNGCSWTFGSELEQDPAFAEMLNRKKWKPENPQDHFNWNILDSNGTYVSRYDEHYDKFNWAGRLKTLLGAKKLVNEATGGGSNYRIVRKTLDYIKQLSPKKYNSTMIVLGWTNCSRSEMNLGQRWHRVSLSQPFDQTVDRLKFDDENIIKTVSKLKDSWEALLYTDYTGVQYYFNSVYMLTALLDNLGINYYFFNALPVWYDGGEYQSDVDVDNCFAIDIELHGKNKHLHPLSDTFFHYANNNREEMPMATYLHPLSTCHGLWAERIYASMKHNGVL